MRFPKLVNGAQMAQIDRLSTEGFGVAAAELMERAGARVVEVLRERWGGLEGLRVAVVCGKGNNGGDGFVIARRLHQTGVAVRAYLAADRHQLTGAAAEQLRRLEEAAGAIAPFAGQREAAVAALREADLVVDALLGTGLRGPARGEAARAIECMNAAARPIVAVDLPSGLSADSGRIEGPCVRAAVTVTFGLAKVGQLFHPGRAECGALELVDIGFPKEAVAECPATTFLLTPSGVADLIPRRPATAHKGTCGAVAVIAGSVGMTGAAALAADAALRAGAGRVTLGVPTSLNDILEVKLTEVMTRPLPEVRRARCLSLRALGEVTDLARGADALAVGPGLGRHRETADLVRRLLGRDDLPATVIDADGLNALASQPEALAWPRPFSVVMTPHAGEFARLGGGHPDAVAADPVGAATGFAARFGVVLVLKGAPTIVAAPDGRAFVNPTGNAGMATAGAGDVLTGLIAGLLAQGVAALAAAAAAVYLHGVAGDAARDDLGEWSVRAGDITERVARAYLQVIRDT